MWLGDGGQKGLTAHTDKAAEAGVAVAEQLLGVGEGALHRFLAAGLDQLPHTVSL